MSELEVKLQQDYGRWSAEYSYAFGDSMWGARGMYNFGKWGSGSPAAAVAAAPPPPPSAVTPFGSASDSASSSSTLSADPTLAASSEQKQRVVDEVEVEELDLVSTGLKGRWSAGGEVFFSAQERAAGVSTGVRFVTLPTYDPSSPGSALHHHHHQHHHYQQPPTTITATLNPIMGQLSTAYTVGGIGSGGGGGGGGGGGQHGGDTALGTRFDFNLYSYDAEVTIGGEWVQRRKRLRARLDQSELATGGRRGGEDSGRQAEIPAAGGGGGGGGGGVRGAAERQDRVGERDLGGDLQVGSAGARAEAAGGGGGGTGWGPNFDAFGRGPAPTAPSPSLLTPSPAPSSPATSRPTAHPASSYYHNSNDGDEVIGVLKARASTNSDLALLWEGKLGDFLVSLGVVADLRFAGRKGGGGGGGAGGRGVVNPIRSVGVGIQYWG
jgi:distribution and morphology protein 10